MPKYLLSSIAIIIVFFFNCITANAQLQDEYVKGKITLQNNQQKEGYIKRESLEKMNCFIYFKETENQKDPVKYDTLLLTGFTMQTGEVFERIKLEITPNADSIYFFGSLLLKGKASVYEIMYKEAQFYIVSNGGTNYPLQEDVLEINATAMTPHYFRNYLTKAIGDSFNARISRMDFNEKSILSIVSEYNKSQSSNNKLIEIKKSNVSFLILNVGIGKGADNKSETYAQGIFRFYAPRYSKSTSLNTGISYYEYNYTENFNLGFYSYLISYHRRLVSVPLQVQQNLLNKNIRPYLIAGLSLFYMDKTYNFFSDGLQKNYGIGLIYGVGVEANIYKGLMAKIEARYELYRHPLSIAIGYNFSKKKR
jgi:hypothetical protein